MVKTGIAPVTFVLRRHSLVVELLHLTRGVGFEPTTFRFEPAALAREIRASRPSGPPALSCYLSKGNLPKIFLIRARSRVGHRPIAVACP